ncbi:OLC1v1022900C1 [Oldenlandia corymbosa var. corymbosa]|uniref:OLC1v1022900C1 n=1 Tax=Oldenlandia corymbosa var. corymbosa TaxID=529605 RepID=A0AAV1BZ99_OLDCO|nr:OLC1v1022900C1 [Oldenlandia corymbosa var. corymbosa]
MSRAGEEEEEDEFFHDSLDRLLSSSNTSCSCSPRSSADSEDPNPFSNPGSPTDCDDGGPDPVRVVPKFPMGVSNNYDVWISQPSSVQERRLRLLRQMGLSRDPSLARHRPSASAVFDSSVLPDLFGRSVLSDQLNEKNPGEGFSSASYSNNISSSSDNISNGSVVDSVNHSNKCNVVPGFVRSKSEGDYKHSDIHSLPAELANEAGNGGGIVVNNKQKHNGSHNVVVLVDNIQKGNGLSNKPPKGKVRTDSLRSRSSNSLSGSGNGDAEEGPEDTGLFRVDDPDNQVCTIKNLDNGEEFVVNEVREDGMWNKLKEVGTGRQLTMEEFEMSVGTSPIVQELMRRQNVENGNRDTADLNVDGNGGNGSKHRKRGSWFKSIRNAAISVAGYKDRRSSDDRDTSSEKGGRRSSSATDDSQDASYHGPERVRVRQYGKSHKELSVLYKSQEIQAHNGSIWTIKFSLDGKYLASAGEDCIIHVWQVVEAERKGDLLFDKPEDGNLNLLFLANGSPEPSLLMSPSLDGLPEKKRRGRASITRKSVSLEHVLVPETIFALSEKPYCSFQGHRDDVLDLSWSKSQHLLSSSMDKTVRLWNLSSNSCLKIFSHSDYVTCIHFNPVDDRYFISGSLDAKVRIWSIPERKVVDWNDLHEMVTAACYTPDGQGALVGSYKGSCHLYDTSDNKLLQRSQINLQSKKKKSHQKKITGFQFAPGSSSEVLITSADSRVRVVDGVDLVHKFKGFRNTNSQISASLTANGKYVVSASEDSHIYIWRHESESRPSRSKGVTVTRSYEHFHCQDVSVAIPWPGMCETWGFRDTSSREQSGPINHSGDVSTVNHPPTPVEESNGSENSPLASGCGSSPLHGTISTATNSYLFDRISATWPEEKLALAAKTRSPRLSFDLSNGINPSRSAWGMVIVAAGLRGEIRTFQNFGLPVRI